MNGKGSTTQSKRQPVVLVCGGRDFGTSRKEFDFVFSTLDRIFLERGWYYGEPDGNWMPDVRIVHGGADGADRAADNYAVVNWTGLAEYKADWEVDGRAAGPIRNQRMLDEEHPDLVIAFPGGRGTADMVRRAKKAGVEVVEVEYEG